MLTGKTESQTDIFVWLIIGHKIGNQLFKFGYLWIYLTKWLKIDYTCNNHECVLTCNHKVLYDWFFIVNDLLFCCTLQDRRLKNVIRDCENSQNCQGLFGLEHTKCARLCMSETCYQEIYAHDEVCLLF